MTVCMWRCSASFHAGPLSPPSRRQGHISSKQRYANRLARNQVYLVVVELFSLRVHVPKYIYIGPKVVPIGVLWGQSISIWVHGPSGFCQSESALQSACEKPKVAYDVTTDGPLLCAATCWQMRLRRWSVGNPPSASGVLVALPKGSYVLLWGILPEIRIVIQYGNPTFYAIGT